MKSAEDDLELNDDGSPKYTFEWLQDALNEAIDTIIKERARSGKLREAVEYTSKQVVWIEGFKTQCTYGDVVEVCRQALAEYERGE